PDTTPAAGALHLERAPLTAVEILHDDASGAPLGHPVLGAAVVAGHEHVAGTVEGDVGDFGHGGEPVRAAGDGSRLGRGPDSVNGRRLSFRLLVMPGSRFSPVVRSKRQDHRYRPSSATGHDCRTAGCRLIISSR